MPHIIIEYSANVEARISMDDLVSTLHHAALETGVFPPGGTRTRTERRDVYRIADGDPENGFVHVTARIGQGRDLETRKRAGDIIFAALCDKLQSAYDHSPLAISFEIQEIEAATSYKKNNLHERLKAKGTKV